MGSAHARRLNLIAFVVLLVALVAGIGLRVHAQRATSNVQHDEAWSYASAAGRLGPFVAAMGGDPGTSLTGRWVPAAEWQRFWTSQGLADVKHIATDLSSWDVHPPLYFGLLHAWLLATGMHVWAGRALNLVFAALTILGIFGLARALGFKRLEGALAALVWAVSPAVVSISSITRQYDLVALTTVLLVWGLVGAVKERRGGVRRLYLLWLAVATAAALLTHYQAVLLVAGAAVYVLAGPLLPARGARRGSWWPPLLALLAGALAAAAAGAGVEDGVRPRALQARRLLRPRLGREALRHQRHPRPLRRPARRRHRVGRRRRRPAAGGAAGRAAHAARADRAGTHRAAGLVGGALLPRGHGRGRVPAEPAVPEHAAAPERHGTWPWPGRSSRSCRCCSSGSGRGRGTRSPRRFCLLVLLPATITAPLLHDSADRLPIGRLADADSVLIDNVGVGELPRFLWDVPAGAQVFAGTQEQLLADKSALERHCPGRPRLLREHPPHRRRRRGAATASWPTCASSTTSPRWPATGWRRSTRSRRRRGE